jgi:soluble lytic murein transglycosylase-like protein
MRILFIILACLWVLYPFHNAFAAEAQQLTPEQEAAVSWVLDNTSKGHDLEESTAVAIVQTAWQEASERGLDPHQLLAIMRQESRFNPKARSVENAQGLMQVMPRWHRAKFGKRSPYDPKASIEVGATVYFDCLTKSSGNVRKAVSCYSGGARKYYQLVEDHKKKLMRHIIAQLFGPTSQELVASH